MSSRAKSQSRKGSGTALALDEACVAHDRGASHPESPRRLEALAAMVAGRDGHLRVGDRLADEAEIVRVHTGDYWKRIADTEGRYVQLDPDTRAGPRSFEAARRAAGAGLEVFDTVMRGEARNGFAMIRPPGHHAEQYTAMGFCLFNSVAVVAEHARHVHGLERIAIVDFDVHHGNGTQHTYYDDPNILYVSTHQAPFYPGTGAGYEVGKGAGEGATVNLPLRGGHGDVEYEAIYGALLPRVFEQFRPDAILVSAGFDLMDGDPLASMRVTPDGIRAIADGLVGAAERLCDGRVVMMLEGGYDLSNLKRGAAACLDALESPNPREPAPFSLENTGDAIHSIDALRAFYTL